MCIRDSIERRVLLRAKEITVERALRNVAESYGGFMRLASDCRSTQPLPEEMPANLQIRFYRVMPFGPIYLIDRRVAIHGLYYQTRTSDLAPMVSARCNRHEKALWNDLEEIYEDVWEDESTLREPPPWLRAMSDEPSASRA